MKKHTWLGVAAALAVATPAYTGFASDPAPDRAPAPAAAGEGGHLMLLQWQAVSVVNPYPSGGTKDNLAGSLVVEPLASITPDGDLVPRLVDEIPSPENGGIADDLMSVTWVLTEGIEWSDGTPLTSADVVATWEYCTSEGSGCAGVDSFQGVADVVAEDELTVRVDFEEPTAFPFLPFVSYGSPIIQAEQFADCMGSAAAGCTEQNQFPIGTGPFVVSEFRAEDTVLYEANENYRGWDDGQPFFSTVEIKGGGDAPAAARTVLEEGAADWGWNLQVPPDLLESMEAAGLGTVQVGWNANMEHLNMIQTNNRNEEAPSEYLDGENPHPFWYGRPDLVRAMSMAIDRNALVTVGYGETGLPACNVWNPEPRSDAFDDWCLVQDIEGANALLDEIGILDEDGDGVREIDGEPLSIEIYTSTNEVRQDFQILLQEWWAEIGIEVSLRDTDAGIFFSTGDQPDSYPRAESDILMFTFVPRDDPQDLFGRYTLASMISEADGWAGLNVPRYYNEDFEALYRELSSTADVDERAALTVQLNDLMIEDGVIIPLVHRGEVVAVINELDGYGEVNGWDSQYWNIAEWFRTE